MWWLSDNPAELEARFGVQVSDGTRVPDRVAAAWEILGGSTRPAVAVTEPEDERVLVYLDHAPRSPYAALRGALAEGSGLPPLLATVAGGGDDFRGHRERRWRGGPGNLHLSILIREPLDAARTGAGLSMLPVVAVVECLQARLPSGRPAGIKWVNDVLVDGRKIAGVIASSSLRGGTIEDSLFGIGLNVAVAPEIEPDVFVPGTTCLAEWTTPPPLGALTLEMLESVQQRFRTLARDGVGPILEAYRRHCGGVGRQVCVWADQPGDPLRRPPLARGILRAVAPDLSLRIEGQPEPVTRGRLAYEDDVAVLAPGDRPPERRP